MFLEKIKDDDFGKTFDISIPDKSISDMNISGQELRLDKAQSPIEDSENILFRDYSYRRLRKSENRIQTQAITYLNRQHPQKRLWKQKGRKLSVSGPPILII